MIDYVLGVNLHAFAEFQAKLATSDPGRLHQLAAMRAAAIDTCSAQLLGAREVKVNGWTVLCPSASQDLAHLASAGLEEKVLLLTDEAVYVVSYEHQLEKIREFVKMPLDCVTGLQHGTLILSTLDSFARDAVEHYGVVVTYQLVSGRGQRCVEARKNTYSLDTVKRQEELAQALKREVAEDDVDVDIDIDMANEREQQQQQQMVFKVVRQDMGRSSEDLRSVPSLSGEATVRALVDALVQARSSRQAQGVLGATPLEMEHRAIRTLEEARASETLLCVCFAPVSPSHTMMSGSDAMPA